MMDYVTDGIMFAHTLLEMSHDFRYKIKKKIFLFLTTPLFRIAHPTVVLVATEPTRSC